MLQKLKSQHREIARLTIEGFSASEIADKLDMNAQSIYQIRRDPLFQHMLHKLEDQADSEVVSVRKKLAEMSFKAVQKLDDLIDSHDDKVALATAKDVLDRSGYKPAEISQHQHQHVHLSADDIKELKSRAAAAGVMITEDSDSDNNNKDINISSSFFAPPSNYLSTEIIS